MTLDSFLELLDTLLGENGCPWDRVQTHESLRENMIEECYEAAEAIDSKNMDSLCEELGDVFLQVAFHAKIAEKSGAFTMEDIIAGVADKVISRHSHIFGNDKAESAEDAVRVWEANKHKGINPGQAMRSVPKALPALMRTAKVLKRSATAVPPTHELYDNINATLAQLSVAKDGHFEIYGKLLLLLVRLSTILEINAEFSLTNAVEEFINTNIVGSPAKSG